MEGGGQSAEFLSTHPSDQRRAGDLKALMPEASAVYQSSTVKYGSGQALTS